MNASLSLLFSASLLYAVASGLSSAAVLFFVLRRYWRDERDAGRVVRLSRRFMQPSGNEVLLSDIPSDLAFARRQRRAFVR